MGGAVLVSSADERYALPAALALLSAAVAVPEPERPPSLLLGVGVERATRARLERAFDRLGAVLHVEALDVAALARQGLPAGMPPAAFARLDLAEAALRYAPRSLYLDADTVTTGPVAELLAVPLSGRPFGAVADEAIPCVDHKNGVKGWRRLAIPPGTPVFNSGVMLVDNERWLEDAIGRAAFEELRDHPEDAAAWDQGALNAAAAGCWLPLESRWNLQVRNAFALRVGGGAALGRQGLTQAPPPGILHFVGRIKPWLEAYPPNPARAAYLHAWRLLLGDVAEVPPARGPLRWAAARAAGRMPERRHAPASRA